MHYPVLKGQTNLQGLNPAGIIDPRYFLARTPDQQSFQPANPGAQMPGANDGQGRNIGQQPVNAGYPVPSARLNRRHRPRLSQEYIQDQALHDEAMALQNDDDEIIEGDPKDEDDMYHEYLSRVSRNRFHARHERDFWGLKGKSC